MTTRPSVLVLNGPNLNMLGRREPDIYGRESLDDIRRRCERHAEDLGLGIEFRQSNGEAELVGWIQDACDSAAALIVNAGALTHTSVGLLDALSMFPGPIVEVHLSNIYRREEFRHYSYVSRAATGVICGLGSKGYELALDAVHHLLAQNERN